MTTSAPNTILIRANGERPKQHGRYDQTTGQAIKPGMPIIQGAAGEVSRAVAASIWSYMLAVESDFADDNTTPANTQVYADGESVAFIHAQPGDEVLLLLADTENASIGSGLALDANSEVVVTTFSATTVAGTFQAVAIEALNNTTGAAAFIRARLL